MDGSADGIRHFDADQGLSWDRRFDTQALCRKGERYVARVLHSPVRPDMLAQRARLDTLTDLALLAPAIHALGGEDAVTQACSAILEAGYWWP